MSGLSEGADGEALFAEREPEILAFLPEEDRFGRLRREAADLEARFPDPASRPPLFGVPVGIKDIFHVSGFATGAGSRRVTRMICVFSTSWSLGIQK